MVLRSKALRLACFVLFWECVILPGLAFILPAQPTRNRSPITFLYFSSSSKSSFESDAIVVDDDQLAPKEKKRRGRRRRSFDDMILKLAEYRKLHGTAQVAKEQDPELYKWTQQVRNEYRYQALNWTGSTDESPSKSKQHRLSADKLKALEDIGFDWSFLRKRRLSPGRRRSFEEMIPKLAEYREMHGTAQVAKEQDPELHKWTQQVRYMYRHQALNWTGSTEESHLKSKKHRLSADKLKALEDIGFDWNPPPSSFGRMIARLSEYRKLHGTAQVAKEQDPELYKWTRDFRKYYRHQALSSTGSTEKSPSKSKLSRLSAQNLKALEDIGFDWNPPPSLFERMIARLSEYRKLHGTAQVAKEQDPELHKWTQQVRNKYRHQALNWTGSMEESPSKSKRSFLSADKLEALEGIGFDWNLPRKISLSGRRRSFEEMVPKLAEYRKLHGTAQVAKEQDPELHKWTQQVRYMYRHQALNWTGSTEESPSKSKRPRLSADKLKALEDIGFDWNLPRKISLSGRRRSFEEMVPKLAEYRKLHGTAQVAKEQDPELYKWTQQVRRHYRYQALNLTYLTGESPSKSKRPRLSADKLKALEDIGFDWNPPPSAFEKMIARLSEYRKLHGTAQVAKEQEPELHKWTQQVRNKFRHQALNWTGSMEESPSKSKRSFLSADKLKALEDIGFDWNLPRKISLSGRRRSFEEMVPKLAEYRKLHGTAQVAKEQDSELHKWTQQVRNKYRHQALNWTGSMEESPSKSKRSFLSADKLKALEDIGFDWNLPRKISLSGRRRSFEEMVPKLAEYRKLHGTAQVAKEQDPELHKWTQQVRYMYRHQALNWTGSTEESPSKSKRPFLSADKLKALEDIGFDWNLPRKISLSGRRRSFEEMVPKLAEYRKLHGTAQVAKEQDPELYKWTQQVRKHYRYQALNLTYLAGESPSKSKRSFLSADKLKALEDIGFDWNPPPSSFERMIARLAEFHDAHGHADVSKEQDPELYKWTQQVRNSYRHQVLNFTRLTGESSSKLKRSRLSAETLQRLQDLDFWWEKKKRDSKRLATKGNSEKSSFESNEIVVDDDQLAPKEKKRRGRRRRSFDDMILKLAEYREMHGATQVSKEQDPELYKWTQQVRNKYRHQALNWTGSTDESPSKSKQHRLSADKLKALEDIGFDWNLPSGRRYMRWQDMIPRLRSFYEEHGHARVPRDHEDRELYRWRRNLIINYGHQLKNVSTPATSSARRKFLSPQRLQQLEELEFDWEKRSTWQQNYEELCQYYKENGHCRVASHEDRALHIFVHDQRSEYRKYLAGNATALSSERREALERINFEWARSHDDRWKERVKDLEDFVEIAGTPHVPQKYALNYQLGRWTTSQRTKYRLRQQGQRSGLTSERIQVLEKLNFLWNIHQLRWENMADRLRQYQDEYGHMEIATSDFENSDLRQWLNLQRHFYRTKNLKRLSEERISHLESIPGFSWRRRRGSGPSKDDWSQLFVALREKGIAPGAKSKQHWFDGTDRFAAVKTEWTEEELLALWNEEDDDDEDEGDYFEDEESRLFLRA